MGRPNAIVGPGLRSGSTIDRSCPTRSSSRCAGFGLSATGHDRGHTAYRRPNSNRQSVTKLVAEYSINVMSGEAEYPRVLSRESELLPPQHSGGRGLCVANEVEFKDVLVDGSDTFRCLTLVFFGKRDQEARISRDAFAPVIPGET